MFRHFFRRFFPPVPPVKRITIRAFAGVAMLFHLPFFSFLSFRHDTLAGKWHHRQISLPLPEFRSLVYTRERIEGENSRKGDYTRYPFDDLRGCSPTCFPRNLQRYSMFKGLTRASFFFYLRRGKMIK